MPNKFYLSLLIHAHQPAGNFDHVFQQSYASSYLPFVELLEKHPLVHVGLHYTGPLLSWIETHRPEYFTRLKNLVRRGQVEMVGGGFYEPILVSIPPEDQHEQIVRLADYIEKHFEQRPTGAWLAERVWEPQLPSALADAGVDYTLVDDIHFYSAGFESEELFGPYVAEDRGKIVRLYPAHKRLRYLIPFGQVHEVIDYLREGATKHPGGIAAMGDDMEKFGVWPGTAEHCYGEGWLENFFTALEQNADWLACVTPGEYLKDHAPLGRADLPTASYTEMMEWVLPTRIRQHYNGLLKEFEHRPDMLSFMRGGPWRAFFRKYPESNLLNKKMLRASRRLAAAPSRRSGSKAAEELLQARDFLLRGQCNDAYWHGVFGGIYAPNLRTELWKNLIRAEAVADKHTPGAQIPRVEALDYDADGQQELLFSAPEYQALLKPSDGATIPMVDVRNAATTLINSIFRRPEAYHNRLRERSGITAAANFDSEQKKVKEEGLERFLRYDHWARNSFRVLLFDPERNHGDFERLDLREDPGVAGGKYSVKTAAPLEAFLEYEGGFPGFSNSQSEIPQIYVHKNFSFGHAPQGFEVACELTIAFKEPLGKPLAIAMESVINFLAPGQPDRFFETINGREDLRFNGTTSGPILKVEDGWQRVRLSLHAPAVQEFWVAPIETVSESEEGFERVYQGSQILALWRPELTEKSSWTGRLVWRVETF